MYWISPRRPQEPAEVSATLPQISDITDSVTIRGEVSELKRVPVFAKSVSSVERLYVEVGQQVQKGQALAVLRPTADAQAVSTARYADLEAAAQALAETDPADWEDILAAMAQTNLYDTQEEQTAQAYVIYSPIAGTVMDVSAAEGESVSTVFPCIVVSDLKQLYVRAYADETAVKKLRAGQACTITVSALTDTKVIGTVSAIKPEATQTVSLLTGTQVQTEITVSLQGGDTALKPGYSASVRVVTDSCEDAVLVPFEVIGQDTENREYVMVWRDGKACKEFIKTRYELESQAEVISGVSKDDLLILDPENVYNGQEVRIIADD